MQHHQSNKVVTFFTGWYKSDVAERGRPLRSQLIDALGSDVALVLSHFAMDECATVEDRRACVRVRFSGLEPLSFVASERMRTVVELTAMLEALAIWPAVLGQISTWCTRNATWSPSSSPPNVSPYVCKGARNSALSPVLGDGPRANQRTSVLLELVSQQRCLAALRQMESDRGVPYETVIFSRLEFTWLKPHPPLELLQPRACIWIPLGEDYVGEDHDYVGLNDRHAVMERDAASAYFGRLEMVMGNGTNLLLLGRHLGRRIITWPSESWLRDRLKQHNQSVCRFASTNFLSCCSNVTAAHCWTQKCWHRGLPPDFACNASLSEGSSPAGAWPLKGGCVASRLHGKYPEELELALQHHVALGMRGSRYINPSMENRVDELEDSATGNDTKIPLGSHMIAVFRPARAANKSAAESLAAVWKLGSRGDLKGRPIAVVGISARPGALQPFVRAVHPIHPSRVNDPRPKDLCSEGMFIAYRYGVLRCTVSTLIRWDLQE